MTNNLENLYYYLLSESLSKTDEVIQKVLQDWVEKGERASRGPHWFPPRELFRYREFLRPTRPDLLKSIKDEGIKEPLLLVFGSDGTVKLAEGNHRLVAAIQLGLDKVPVVFEFMSSAEKHKVQFDKVQMEKDVDLARKKSKEKEREAFRRKYGLDKTREKEEERRRREWEKMSPEERKKAEEENEERVKSILDILGV